MRRAGSLVIDDGSLSGGWGASSRGSRPRVGCAAQAICAGLPASRHLSSEGGSSRTNIIHSGRTESAHLQADQKKALSRDRAIRGKSPAFSIGHSHTARPSLGPRVQLLRFWYGWNFFLDAAGETRATRWLQRSRKEKCPAFWRGIRGGQTQRCQPSFICSTI